MFFLMIFASAADLGRCRRHKIGPKIEPKNIFQPTFFFDQNVLDFFDEKNSRTKNVGYLFRAQISPRFQKSYLENCARSLDGSTRLVTFISRNCNMEACHLVRSSGVLDHHGLMYFHETKSYYRYDAVHR